MTNKNVKWIRKIIIGFLCYLLITVLIGFVWSSCSEIKMEDSSSDPMYSSRVGKRLRLREDVWILGISSNNNLPADYFALVPGVGFGGREVVSRGKLKKGTILGITRVLTGKVILSTRVQYGVELISNDHFAGKDIRITMYDDYDEATFGLDSNVYEVIN